MGDSDEDSNKSPGEGSSSKSGNDNAGKKSKPRKKKSKRRTSAASDTDTSDVEGGRSVAKKSSRKKNKPKKQVTDDTNDGNENNDGAAETDNQEYNGDLKDTMLDAIKSRRKANMLNGQAGGGSRRDLKKDVCFTGSTIQRDLSKDKSGIMPEPKLEGDVDPQSALMAAMGKIPPASAGGSALKPSKYGKNKKTSFAVDEPKWKVSPDDDDDETEQGFEIGPRKNKPTFRNVDFGSPDDDGADRPKGISNVRSSIQRRARRLNSSSSNSSLGDPPQSMTGTGGDSDRRPSFQPEQITPGRVRTRRATDGEDNDEELRASLTALRPGIQRRNSMGSSAPFKDAVSLLMKKNSSNLEQNEDDKDGAAESAQARMNFVQAAKTVSTLNAINQHKQIRRLQMSVEDQTFIPPKSRQSSMFQAFTHVMAGRLVDLTLWTYGASFLKVMFFFLVFYILNIFIWAAVLDAVDLASGGQCVHDEPENLTKGARYELVVELAWATFTTVGYGTISPQGDTSGCYAIRFTCAFVAFIGVLFASTTAAIMYSKLMRLLAHAHVTFSSTLCVQYGKGNEGSTVRFGQLNFRASVAPAQILKQFSASDLLNDGGGEEEAAGTEDGFPVIEFRMINDRANHEGSEIWDAQIRGIVQLHKDTTENKATGVGNSFAVRDKATGGESTLDLEKKVYYPISLSPDSHPHFSRIWYARHVLNAESPLLKREIRDMIVKDGGKWDKDFNTWKEIRDCMNEFISLRITLSGTSAVSASAVYGEHVYEFDDVCVGWRFANMVYEKKNRYNGWFGRAPKDEDEDSVVETKTKIDVGLLHDIVPQPGGDHEPLNETKDTRRWHVSLLSSMTS